MKTLALSVILLLFISTACQRSNRNGRNERQVEWAYQLVDQGHYSDAIIVFQNLIDQDDNPTNRIGLASAYAARAGVHVQKYWDFVFPSLQAQAPKSFESTEMLKLRWSAIIKMSPNELRSALEEKSPDIFKANDQLETLKWRFQKIPKIQTQDQRADLMNAREVLHDLPSKGSHLYRALLTLMIIRFDLEQVNLPIADLEKLNKGWPCPAPLEEWLQKVPAPLEMVFDLITDVKLAHPNKGAEIEALEADFHKRHFEVITTLRLMESSLCRNH